MKRYKDLISGVIVVVFSIAIYISSNGIQRMVSTSIGPDFMPKLAAVLMGILGVILTIQGALSAVKAPAEITAADAAAAKRHISFIELFKNNLDIATLVLLTLYSLVIGWLGFLISTSVYIFLQIMLMSINKKKKYIVFIAISVIFTCVIYFLFTKVLYVMLPVGILG